MKRIAIAAALIATITLSTTPARAAPTINVREMINLCTSDGVIGKNACMTLIVGFVDGFDAGTIFHRGKKFHCRPARLKNGEMVERIKEMLPYTKQSSRHLPAAAYVIGLLKVLFPCGSKV